MMSGKSQGLPPMMVVVGVGRHCGSFAPKNKKQNGHCCKTKWTADTSQKQTKNHFWSSKKQTKYASRASTLITLLLFNDLFAQILPTLIKCYLKLSTYLDLIKANGQNRQTLKIY